MRKQVANNVQLVELYEEEPQVGSITYRLLKYEDGDPGQGGKFLVWELYKAEHELEEWGDAETGPRCSLIQGEWKLVGQGMGHIKSIEDAISMCQHCPFPD